jgi:hypothetical protein
VSGGGLGAAAAGPGAFSGRFGDGGDGEPAEPDTVAGPLRRRWRRRTVRELAALGWIWAAIVATYLLGFEIGVPLVAAAYSLTSVEWNRRWQRFAYAAVVTGLAFGIASCFLDLFHLSFTGVLL